MSKKRKESAAAGEPSKLEAARRNAASIARFTVLMFLLVATAFSAGYGAWRFDQFLRDDGRFLLEPERAGVDSPVEINGARNASRAAILRVFAIDRGRSLYLMNLQERRQQIVELEWVRNASVRRLWPNRVAVDIEERVPVALVPSTPPVLIDADGYLLTPRGKVPPRYPVLNGLRDRDSAAIRKERVRRMQLVLGEVGAYRKNVLEVDVASAENPRLVYQHGDQVLTLAMGSEKYKEKLDHLFAHYDTIRDRLSDNPVLDLRLEERITIAQ